MNSITRIMTGKRKILVWVMVVLMLLQMQTGIALALSEGPDALTGVTVDTDTYSIPDGDSSVTISKPLKIGSQPRIVLNFSHNVQNEDYLEDNLELIYMVKIGSSGSIEDYIDVTLGAADEKAQTGIFIRPDVGLEEGNYKIVVEEGITSNHGSTGNEYEVLFSVGEIGGGEEPELDPDAYSVTFDIQNIKRGVEYTVTVRQGNEIYYPVSGSVFSLLAGDYTYAVSAPGYVTATGSLTVSGDDTISVAMVDHVIVTFKITPSDASVKVKFGQDNYINPQSNGTFKLTPGIEYTYVAEKAGYITKSQRFTPVGNLEISATMDPDVTPDGEYGPQGNGGNTLTMLSPGADKIEVIKVTDSYYYNRVTSALSASSDIVFKFTMGAGVNNFNEAGFITNNMPIIGIYKYKSVGSVGSSVAQYDGGSGNLKYIGFENLGDKPEDKQISIGFSKGVLSNGTYVLKFAKNVCGNNVNKTIGKDIMVEFQVGSGSTPVSPGRDKPKEENDDSEIVEENPINETDTKTIFTDVKKTDWFSNATSYVVGKGLFLGTSATTFSPKLLMDRGMFVTVLGRFAGIDPSGQSESSFTDVVKGAYYDGHVVWAAEKGVVEGTGDGTFAPTRKITRQEAAVFMYRYYKLIKGEPSDANQSAVSGFSDGAEVADWAMEAMNWAITNKIINGNNDGSLNPKGSATRAEVAQIIKNFVENIQGE